VDDVAKDLLRGVGGIEGGGDAGAFGSAHQLAKDFGVQAEFVAEGVVDGGNIGAGAAADFADGGFVETLAGENFG